MPGSYVFLGCVARGCKLCLLVLVASAGSQIGDLPGHVMLL